MYTSIMSELPHMPMALCFRSYLDELGLVVIYGQLKISQLASCWSILVCILN